MNVLVNGEPAEVTARTLDGLLGELDYTDAVVATAVNGDFVPVRARQAHILNEGDRIEIVAPRQGG